MNGYGASVTIATGIGQMAYTGVNTLGMSLLAGSLVLAGLIILRLGVTRRASRTSRQH